MRTPRRYPDFMSHQQHQLFFYSPQLQQNAYNLFVGVIVVVVNLVIKRGRCYLSRFILLVLWVAWAAFLFLHFSYDLCLYLLPIFLSQNGAFFFLVSGRSLLSRILAYFFSAWYYNLKFVFVFPHIMCDAAKVVIFFFMASIVNNMLWIFFLIPMLIQS